LKKRKIVERLDKHEYKYETIVIGGGLSALLFSYYNDFPCIFSEPSVPFEFDVFDGGTDVSFLGLRPGASKTIVWQRLIMALALGGLLPMGDKVASLSVQENKLKASTHNSRLGRFEFDKLIVFDDKSIRGLPKVSKLKRVESLTGFTFALGWSTITIYLRPKTTSFERLFSIPQRDLETKHQEE